MTTYPTEMKNKENPLPISEIIILDRVGKKYPLAGGAHPGHRDFWVLKDVSLQVATGEILGIIGRNGAGKTTLLNMIAGVLSPTEGEISVRGRVLGLFNLGVGFQDELTGRENVFLNGTLLGATRQELESKIDAIIGFSELEKFVDMPLGTYSQGMRLRLAFSIVSHLDFEVLVMDEVLAVGDALFQSKCFERLMDFKRAGKTLILTTQSLELIERLCDTVLLLDHGKKMFLGNGSEATNQYRALLSTEKFYVGPEEGVSEWEEDTKKWTDDISEWGQKKGTRETIITSVDFVNSWGFKRRVVKTHQPLRIRVAFNARNKIREPHFGIAIFRSDGVYCYGPNTVFDEQVIREIQPGTGWFELQYRELWLASGEYKISVAIWDKHETLPFDYHSGYYDLKILSSEQGENELVNLSWKARARFRGAGKVFPALSYEKELEAAGNVPEIKAASATWFDASGVSRDVLRTAETASLKICIEGAFSLPAQACLWAGLFREDGVYCQGFMTWPEGGREQSLFFPQLSLLPGKYRVRVGVWDPSAKKFLGLFKEFFPFRMIFNRKDHGTIYLKHVWKWELPK